MPWAAAIAAAGTIGGALISSGSDTQTQTYQPPPKYQQAYNQVLDRANAVAGTPYQPYTDAIVAGFTPAQLEAFKSVDKAAGLANPYLNNASQATANVQKNPISGKIPTLSNNAAGSLAASAANTYTANAPNYLQGAASALPYFQQLLGNPGQNLGVGPLDIGGPSMPGYDVPSNLGGTANNLMGTQVPTATSGMSQYMDPYLQSVIDATQAHFNNQNEQQRQKLIGNAISSGAWGGDRAGVAQAALAGEQNLSQAPVIADLYSRGFDKSLAASQQDQQVALQKLGMGNQYGTLGLGYGQAMNDDAFRAWQAMTGFGLQQQGQLGQLGLGAQQLQSTSGLGALDAIMGGLQAQDTGTLARAQGASGMYNQNAGTALQGATATANQQLAAAQQQANLGNSALENQLKQANAQLQAGTMQQQLAQNQLNAAYQQYKESTQYPVAMTEWLANITTGLGGAAGGTGTSTTPTGNALSGAIGGGLAASQLANNLGYFNAPKATYDTTTGNYTPGPGGFAKGGNVNLGERFDDMKNNKHGAHEPMPVPAATSAPAPALPGDVAGNGAVYTPALGDVLPGTAQGLGNGHHDSRNDEGRFHGYDSRDEWHDAKREERLARRERRWERHHPGQAMPGSSAPPAATPTSATPAAPTVDPAFASLGFQYAPGPWNASNVLGNGGGGGGDFGAIPALATGTPGSALSTAPVSNYKLPTLPNQVMPYGNWTPPAPQTPGVQAAYNAPMNDSPRGAGDQNNSPLQDIAQALAAGIPVSAQSWASAGYGPGGIPLNSSTGASTMPANARMNPYGTFGSFADGGSLGMPPDYPGYPEGNVHQYDTLLPDAPWPEGQSRREMIHANSVLSHIAAAGMAAWERVKAGQEQPYDADAVLSMWTRGSNDESEDGAITDWLKQKGLVQPAPQGRADGGTLKARAPGGNLGVGYFDAPDVPTGPGFSTYNVSDLLDDERERQRPVSPFQNLMKRSAENMDRSPPGLADSPTAVGNTDTGSSGTGGALNRMMDNPESMSLFLAGLGMLGGKSTNAGRNIAEGAMQGIGYLQNRRDQEASRAERAEERDLRRRQVDISERNAAAEADRMAKEIARWDRQDELAERRQTAEELDKTSEFVDRNLARTSQQNYQTNMLNRQTIKDEQDAAFRAQQEERLRKAGESEDAYRERMAGVAERNADAGRFSFVGTDPDGKPIYLDARTGETKIGDVKIGAKPSAGRGPTALEREVQLIQNAFPGISQADAYAKAKTAVSNPNERAQMLQREAAAIRRGAIDITGRPTMTEAEIMAQAMQNVTQMQQSLNGPAPSGAPPAAAPPAAAAPAAPGAAVTPPRPSNVPAGASYSPSQKSWWWQENGQWKSAPG